MKKSDKRLSDLNALSVARICISDHIKDDRSSDLVPTLMDAYFIIRRMELIERSKVFG